MNPIPSSTSTAVTFFCAGKPAPGGSKKAFPLWRGKGASRQWVRTIVTDASGPRGKTWRTMLQWEAKVAMGGKPPMEGAIEVKMQFYLRRPKAHFRRGKMHDMAPLFPLGKPDALKLGRAVEDAMTGIVYMDDSQIVAEWLYKSYATPALADGVLVEVRRVET